MNLDTNSPSSSDSSSIPECLLRADDAPVSASEESIYGILEQIAEDNGNKARIYQNHPNIGESTITDPCIPARYDGRKLPVNTRSRHHQ